MRYVGTVADSCVSPTTIRNRNVSEFLKFNNIFQLFILLFNGRHPDVLSTYTHNNQSKHIMYFNSIKTWLHVSTL
jgi:hypothetical protein